MILVATLNPETSSPDTKLYMFFACAFWGFRVSGFDDFRVFGLRFASPGNLKRHVSNAVG